VFAGYSSDGNGAHGPKNERTHDTSTKLLSAFAPLAVVTSTAAIVNTLFTFCFSPLVVNNSSQYVGFFLFARHCLGAVGFVRSIDVGLKVLHMEAYLLITGVPTIEKSGSRWSLI
jgi:hypothetical protein